MAGGRLIRHERYRIHALRDAGRSLLSPPRAPSCRAGAGFLGRLQPPQAVLPCRIIAEPPALHSPVGPGLAEREPGCCAPTSHSVSRSVAGKG